MCLFRKKKKETNVEPTDNVEKNVETADSKELKSEDLSKVAGGGSFKPTH